MRNTTFLVNDSGPASKRNVGCRIAAIDYADCSDPGLDIARHTAALCLDEYYWTDPIVRAFDESGPRFVAMQRVPPDCRLSMAPLQIC